MSEKLFGDLANADEINELANNLMELNELDEIRTLAKENEISLEKAEDFISGKRNTLTDTDIPQEDEVTEQKDKPAKEELKKKFTSGAEKLAYEEENLLKNVAPNQRAVIKEQFDLVFKELIKKCNEDLEFNTLVIQEHKTWERCYLFMEEKARKIAAKNAKSCAVISTTLFAWIDEYYKLDDKASIEKEAADKKKAAEERKKREATQKTKAEKPKNNEKSTVNKNDTTSVQKDSKNVERAIEEPKKTKKKNEPEGQMSLFDFQF